jgi:apolipoprotein N-acyltransferase
MGNGKEISVAVVQGNIDQAVKWDEATRDNTLDIYDRLSLSFSKQPDLVIWPESAMPFFFQNEPLYQQKIFDLVNKGGFHLLFGSPAFQSAPEGTVRLLNSAYLFPPTPAGQGSSPFAEARYDKIHLVPFGEYVPLKSMLFFVDKMVTGIGEFVPGKEARVLDIRSAKIGTAICYEVIFPDLVRRFVNNGANMMATITNDAWFGQSAAPFQHFSMVVFRAIENRVPIARSANTGISGFIDAHGKILQETPIFAEEARLQQLPLGFRRTFYTAYGDIFALGCFAIILALLLSSYRIFWTSTAKGV